VAVAGICWAYVGYMAWGMANMDVAADWLLMPRMTGWGISDLALVLAMWMLMMAAMMLPSATPLLLLVHRATAQQHGSGRAALDTIAFALGYLAVWSAFSVLATAAQWALLEERLVSPMMDSSSPYLSGVLLVAAGAYQFSGLKLACLARCRSPLSFLMTQRGHGAFVLGVRHGVYCAGCCWLIMALLFVLGVMNLWWILGLTLFVLLEKFLRQPRGLVSAGGAALVAWGLLVLGYRILPVAGP